MTHILKAFASDSFISIAIQKQYKFTGSKTTIFQVRALTVCRSNDASLALEKQQNTLYLSNNITIRLKLQITVGISKSTYPRRPKKSKPSSV
jgi:hypothetical protein